MKNALPFLISFILAAVARGQVDNSTTQGEFIENSVVSPEVVGQTVSVDSLTLKSYNYFGNGCPKNTLSITLSPDNTVLSVIFDKFILQLPKGPKQIPIGTAYCELHLLFQPPADMQVAITALDYRGYNNIPARSAVYFLSDYFFSLANHRIFGGKVIRTKLFHGPLDSEYTLSAVSQNRTLVSPCGKKFFLHINQSLIAQTNFRQQQLLSTVDSLDAVVEPTSQTIKPAHYYLSWQRCGRNQ